MRLIQRTAHGPQRQRGRRLLVRRGVEKCGQACEIAPRAAEHLRALILVAAEGLYCRKARGGRVNYPLPLHPALCRDAAFDLAARVSIVGRFWPPGEQ